MPFDTYPSAVRPVEPDAPPLPGIPGNTSGMRRHTDFFHFPP